jgi:hypothetical protein
MDNKKNGQLGDDIIGIPEEVHPNFHCSITAQNMLKNATCTTKPCSVDRLAQR